MSTPPLRSQNSAKNLNLINLTTEEKSIVENEKQTIDSWKAAQANVDTSGVPTLRSKTRQDHLRLVSTDSNISEPHNAPTVKVVKNATSDLADSSTFPIASSSTKSSGNDSSSSTILASPKGKANEKREVQASDLPMAIRQIIDIGLQNSYILTPEKLARLILTVESQCGKKIVSADNIKAILREPLPITNYQSISGVEYEKFNIMERFGEPFIQHHLDAKILDDLLQKVMREYSKVAEKVTKLSEGLRPVEQVNHPDVVALMAPAMKWAGDYFFGADMTLSSSKFPDPIKKLFLAIDSETINWFKKTGSGEMKDLTQLRKNTLIGFISTYTFMTIWTPKLAADNRQGAGFYAKLTSYINSYLVNKLDVFVMDILLNQEHQSPEAKTYISKSLKASKSSPQSAGTLRVKEADKGGPLSAIKSLFSPRSKSTASSNAKSVDASGEDSGFREEEIRKSEMQRKRIIRLTRFTKTAGFNLISRDFYIFIRNKLIDLGATDYNSFTKNPVAYCHQQLKLFTAQSGENPPGRELVNQIEQSLNSYQGSSESDKDDTASKSSSSQAEQKIYEKNNDVQAESSVVSEKTESDSSTSVETEETDE